ncbi:hypothetical protein [Solwaraspora sp. WMMA2065]|uniref:hypothetical protein n=1 Tax=Solwaraspora sp. WMMA2065 TaxID=3015166 RepID=UPI00259B165B|nr:hypothetical protein [Solwaraspora sp. WMMA2065]WJK35081.1 hypothetical protein O7610_01345 [Solwaraspora sp. WMMA2065]
MGSTTGLPEPIRSRPWTVRVAAGLLIFVGVTAVGGGVEMWLYPYGNEFVRTEWLRDLPLIDTWRLPGLVLGAGLGLGSLVSAFGLLRRPRWRWLAPVQRVTGRHWSWAATGVSGIALGGWILLEVVLLPQRSIIEALYGILAAGLVGLCSTASLRRSLALTPDRDVAPGQQVGQAAPERGLPDRRRLLRRERVLIGLETFLAVSAVGGAVGLTTGGMDLGPVTADLPFASPVLAGAALAAVNGVLPGVVVVAAVSRRSWAPLGHLVVGAALVLWIVVQVAVIGPVSWLQPVFLGYGLAVVGLALRLPLRPTVGAAETPARVVPGR